MRVKGAGGTRWTEGCPRTKRRSPRDGMNGSTPQRFAVPCVNRLYRAVSRGGSRTRQAAPTATHRITDHDRQRSDSPVPVGMNSYRLYVCAGRARCTHELPHRACAIGGIHARPRLRTPHVQVCALHGVSPRDWWLCVLPRWQVNVNVHMCLHTFNLEIGGEARRLTIDHAVARRLLAARARAGRQHTRLHACRGST